MAYTAVSFAYKEVLTSAKMTLLAENDAYLKGITDTLTGAWTSVTPTFGNFVAGASSVVARYKLNGKTLDYAGLVTLGAGFSMNSSPVTVSLPASINGAAQNNIFNVIGTSMLNDSGSGTQFGMVTPSTSTTFLIRSAAGAAVSIAAPFAWTTSDSFSWNVRCEVA